MLSEASGLYQSLQAARQAGEESQWATWFEDFSNSVEKYSHSELLYRIGRLSKHYYERDYKSSLAKELVESIERELGEDGDVQQAEAIPTYVSLTADQQCARDAVCAAGEAHWWSLAEVYCPPLIEDFARYRFTWTDGWFGDKFDRLTVVASQEGAIKYIGDELEFQNGFGAWQRMNYSCVVDPVEETVIAVDVW